MKGKIQNIMWIVLLAILYGCQEETFDNKQAMDENVLTLTLATQPASRADPNGDDRFNENKIERADVYFFPVNASTQETQTCVYAQTDLSADADNVVLVPLDRTVLTEDTYYVYAVANYDLGYTPETAVSSQVTIAQLKAKTISTEWKQGLGEEETVIEESLVMDGAKEIILQNTQATTDEIKITRAMAKVMLYASTEAQIEMEGATYRPNPSGMNVTMVYGVNKTNLAGTYNIQAADDYITRMKRNYTTNTIPGEDGKVLYEQEAPFYSYPNPENTTDRQDSYLILCVPWQITTSEGPSYQAQDYYYRIPITGDASLALLERNHYYRIKVNIGVLGSLNPRDAVELTANFEIMDWFEVGIDADMQNYRYLVLDEYNSVMNNVDVLEMPYASSSAIADIDNKTEDGNENYTEITEISFWDYREENAKHCYYAESEIENYTDENGNSMEYLGPVPTEYRLEYNENNLIFTHVLDDDDYVAITIKITAYNRQGVKADEWTITQYPAMYIEGEYNRNGDTNRFIYGETSGRYTTYDDDGNYLGGANSVTSGSNNNPYQYTIYISSFDIEGSDYAIGDPRSESVDNLSALRKRDYYNENLTYYYPARQEDADNVVAPAFKIASSWGVTYDISFESAQKRCASYQENGYPAGRWRVPTEAEIAYVVSLSHDEKIPELFDGTYFASSGNYYNSSRNDFTGSGGAQAVRCVYDVWYWGDDKIENPNRFTWGDEPRQ